MEGQANSAQVNQQISQPQGGKSAGVDMFDKLSSIDLVGETPKQALVNKILNGDSKDESVSSSPEGKSQEKGQKEEVKVSVVQKGEEKETAVPPKAAPKVSSPNLIKALAGDAEIEIPDDTVFTVKVDGKEEKVTYKELQNNYQGKKPWDKHYRETKEERRKVDEERKFLETELDEILNLADIDPPKMLEKIAILRGKSPVDVLPIWIKQAQNTVKELENYSEADLKRLFEKRGLEYEKLKLDKEKQKTNEQQQALHLERYLGDKIASHGVTQEELQRAVKVIEESKVDLSKKTAEEVIDLTINYVTSIDRKYSKVESALDKLDPTLRANNDLVTALANLVSPDFTIDDIVDIARQIDVVKEVLGSSVSESTEPESDQPESETEEDEEEEVAPKKVVSGQTSKNSSKESPRKSNSPKISQKKQRQETEDDDDPITFQDLLRPYRR